MKTNKRAISLIVLVITIIVMIILATAIIITLSNSGIIDKANEAVDKTNDAQVQQIAQLGWAEAYAEFGADLVKLDEGVVNALEANGIDPNDYERNVTKTGVTLTKKEKAPVTLVPEEWKPNVSAIVDGVPIPAGFVASSVVGETEKDTGLVIYEGEEAVTASNHYDALRTRNQYVWVPVPDFSKFIRRSFGDTTPLINTLGPGIEMNGYDGRGGDWANAYWEVELDENNMPTDTKTGIDMYDINNIAQYISDEELATIKAMYASVKKYGGFYTARYEQGKNVSFTMNALPDVPIYRLKYPSRNSVTETIIYGVQWDTTIQWILDTGVTLTGYNLKQEVTLNDLNEGSKYAVYICYDPDAYELWGACPSRGISEYQTITQGKSQGVEWYLTTGALKSAKLNNIYDMLGNYEEYTNEKYGGGQKVIRNGKNRVSYQQPIDEGEAWRTATRSALYINN